MKIGCCWQRGGGCGKVGGGGRWSDAVTKRQMTKCVPGADERKAFVNTDC